MCFLSGNYHVIISHGGERAWGDICLQGPTLRTLRTTLRTLRITLRTLRTTLRTPNIQRFSALTYAATMV